MKMNKNKCGIMKIAKKASKITFKTHKGEIKTNKHLNVPYVNTYKYLGIHVDAGLTFKMQYNTLKGNLKSSLAHITRVSTKLTSVYLKYHLFKTYALSHLNYSSIIFFYIR